ncbi:MAG: hypothetical protein ABSG65_14035 [Bryobacteraceae bacterium]
MSSYTLPHGARGIEGEDFAVQFGDDKVVWVPKSAGAGKHYTFQAKPASGVIDLHETTMDADGREQHRTLFALRRDDLPPMLQELTPMVPELFRLMRPLRLGWLKHRDIAIARGIDPVTYDDIAAVTRKRRRRLILDAQRYEQNLYVPEYLEEVFEFPDGNFSLYHRGRKIGIGFKKTDGRGGVHLFWIKLRDLTRFGNAWQAKVATAMSRFAIPPEKYVEYPFLRS